MSEVCVRKSKSVLIKKSCFHGNMLGNIIALVCCIFQETSLTGVFKNEFNQSRDFSIQNNYKKLPTVLFFRRYSGKVSPVGVKAEFGVSEKFLYKRFHKTLIICCRSFHISFETVAPFCFEKIRKKMLCFFRLRF